MARKKFDVGEKVEVRCAHHAGEKWANDWVQGVVVQADHRMAAVQFACDVLSSNGWIIPDRTLWLAHGSKNIRPVEQQLS
jgi:hypothetical protein